MLKLVPLLRILMLAVFLSVCHNSFGQPEAPPEEPPIPDVPITGIEILIGLGGLLGAKKYYDLRKKSIKD